MVPYLHDNFFTIKFVLHSQSTHIPSQFPQSHKKGFLQYFDTNLNISFSNISFYSVGSLFISHDLHNLCYAWKIRQHNGVVDLIPREKNTFKFKGQMYWVTSYSKIKNLTWPCDIEVHKSYPSTNIGLALKRKF